MDIYFYKPSYSRWAIAGRVLDGPAVAGDQLFKGSNKVGPGHFVENFRGGLYMVRIW